MLYLNPTLVLLIGRVLFKRTRRARRSSVALAVSYAGVLLVFGHELHIAGSNVMLGAALVFAQRRELRDLPRLQRRGGAGASGSLRLTGLATTVACLLCLAQFALTRPLAARQRRAAGAVAVGAQRHRCARSLPVLMVMMAIERVGATVAAQTGMVGPVSTILMGIVILGEPFTVWIAIGTVFVLSGIWMLAKARPRP